MNFIPRESLDEAQEVLEKLLCLFVTSCIKQLHSKMVEELGLLNSILSNLVKLLTLRF